MRISLAESRLIVVSMLLGILLSACGGSGSNSLTDALNPSSVTLATQIGGSIGDGPVIDATIVVTDRNGNVILSEKTSSTTYNLNLNVRGGKKVYPLLVEAQGGKDLVSNTSSDLPLLSVATSPSTKNVNINVFSTFIVKTALAMSGGLTDANIATARSAVLSELNFGFDTTVIDDPITADITSSNAAMIIKASEALGEMVRRTRDVYKASGVNLTTNDIMNALAADLSDGLLNGTGAANTNPRISAIAKIVSGQVLVEAMTNTIKVNGADATTALDNSILYSFPDIPPSDLTESVPMSAQMIVEAENAVNSALSLAPNTGLSDILTKLGQITAGDLASTVRTILPSTSDTDFDAVISDMTTASTSEIAIINGTAVPNSPPIISSTPATSVTAGSTYSFQPSASDPDGDSLTFSIANKPAWASFSASTGRLSGTPSSTQVGIYSGITISVSDGQSTTSLPTFSITVNKPTTVSATLSWTPPSTKADGSPLSLSEIAGYRIYEGTTSSNLTLLVDLSDPTATTYAVTGLESGTHYFSVSVYDVYGDEGLQSQILSTTIM